MMFRINAFQKTKSRVTELRHQIDRKSPNVVDIDECRRVEIYCFDSSANR